MGFFKEMSKGRTFEGIENRVESNLISKWREPLLARNGSLEGFEMLPDSELNKTLGR